MTRRWSWTSGVSILFLCMAGGCAERELRAGADFEELCGEPGPVRLLEFEGPMVNLRDLGRFGARRILQVTEQDGSSQGLDGQPHRGAKQTWSVGLCGESPLLLEVESEDISWRPPQWPELLLRCDESGGVWVLDPTGAKVPSYLFELDRCALGLRDTELGLFGIGQGQEGDSALVFHPWPSDPWAASPEASVLVEGVRPESLQLGGEFAFVVTSLGELLRVRASSPAGPASPVSAEIELLETDVRSAVLSHDGRYVSWKSLELSNEDPEQPEGEIWLRELETGATHLLKASGSAALRPHSTQGTAEGYILESLEQGNPIGSPARYGIYALPSLAYDEFEVAASSIMHNNEGHLWFSLRGGGVALYEVASAELRVLFEGGDAWFGSHGEGWVSIVDCCGGLHQPRVEGPLWRIHPYDEAELVAERGTSNHRYLHGGGLVTLVEIGEDWSGELILIDPLTLEERLIDTSVRDMSIDMDDESRNLSYLVHTGEGAQVWAASLSPSP